MYKLGEPIAIVPMARLHSLRKHACLNLTCVSRRWFRTKMYHTNRCSESNISLDDQNLIKQLWYLGTEGRCWKCDAQRGDHSISAVSIPLIGYTIPSPLYLLKSNLPLLEGNSANMCRAHTHTHIFFFFTYLHCSETLNPIYLASTWRQLEPICAARKPWPSTTAYLVSTWRQLWNNCTARKP
jgi:hypothetical protein